MSARNRNRRLAAAGLDGKDRCRGKTVQRHRLADAQPLRSREADTDAGEASRADADNGRDAVRPIRNSGNAEASVGTAITEIDIIVKCIVF